MTEAIFEKSVFINCPFDDDYAPLLEAMLFCITYFGLIPRLASERAEAGENRLDKITELIQGSKFSLHDLSLARANKAKELFRMNMPFELGIDIGFRRCGDERMAQKKYLIFEQSSYELKQALSDIAGQDVVAHNGDFQKVIKEVRNFFRSEANLDLAGPQRIEGDYYSFQGWMTEKKVFEGHSEEDALNLPTRERLVEMQNWIALGKPVDFAPL